MSKKRIAEGRVQVSVRKGTYDTLSGLSASNGMTITDTLAVAVAQYASAQAKVSPDVMDRIVRLTDLLEEIVDGKK